MMIKDKINEIINNKKIELEEKYEANKEAAHAEGEKIKAKLKKIGIICVAVLSGLVLLFIFAMCLPDIEEEPEEPTPISIEEVSKSKEILKQPIEEVPEEPIEEKPVEEAPEEQHEEPKEEVQEPVSQPEATAAALVEVEEPEEEQEKEYDFVLNTNSHKYHSPYCSDGKSIKSKNRAEFHGTISEVESKGYVACKRCGGI